ncbi:amidohydrolase family protein [Isoptericola sp. b515]|uniref:amidohydrolase n=1 Tax=Isoptericola sp. b515 TaxID=3064652 RepID=UPI00271426C4|nr:amidohydrolase family protein [Isoptericola sp. b515]MDO8149617.1 amidohydrolase family protein [Isoptericola sp. b515]
MTSTLYRNGVVHSAADPFAEALLVDDGVVAWLGAEDTAAGLAARADEVVDLNGALVTPGFVDAHVHTLETGLTAAGVDLSPAAGGHTLAAALDRLAAAARDLDAADPGGQQILLALGWDEGAWPEGRAPWLSELDAATGGRPTLAVRVDGHSALASSSLAARTGLDRTPDWDGTGLVGGQAYASARAAVHDLDPARRETLYRRALSQAAARGIVAVHEMSTPHVDTREGLTALMSLAADPDQRLPHVTAYRAELCTGPEDARALLAELPFLTGIGGDLTVDGTLGSRTAALTSPYTDLPSEARERTGRLYLSADQIATHLLACSAAGVQGGLHVVGDRAMDELVEGLEVAVGRADAATLRGGHHRIEHALFVDAAALASLLLYGMGLSIQPAYDSTWGGPDGMYTTRLGGPRAANLSPFADLAGAGVPIAFGSDSPVTPLDPWQAVRAAIGHADPSQRVSARSAFRAHSRGGWRLAGLDHTGAGELRVGAPAHLAVWRTGSLAVQSAPGRLSQWNPEARAGQPLLPDLSEDAPAPQCLRTVRDGVVLHDVLDG